MVLNACVKQQKRCQRKGVLASHLELSEKSHPPGSYFWVLLRYLLGNGPPETAACPGEDIWY